MGTKTIASHTLMRLFQLSFLLSIFFIISSKAGFGQTTNDSEDNVFGEREESFSLYRDDPLTIDLESEEEEEGKTEVKKKKRKKKVFYGLKTKKGWTRRGVGEQQVIETFYILREPPELDAYVPEVYFYDIKSQKISKTRKFDPRKGFILHGPYKKRKKGMVIEEGIFYKGTMHGRWMQLNTNDILLNKKFYYKGWPKESKVKYYDPERTKLKEVIPIVYGEVSGTYYMFHENGEIAIRGRYEKNVKVGKWTEYYDFLGRKKKELQYPPTAYDEKFKPFISKEWNKRSQLVYQSGK